MYHLCAGGLSCTIQRMKTRKRHGLIREPFLGLLQSCVSEDQKYQGHLYKDKAAKQANKKTVKISETVESNSSSKPRKAYVEDAPDADSGSVTVTTVEAPPEAPPVPPSPLPSPTAVSTEQPSVNVFDFLVPSDSPEAPRPSVVPETAKSKKSVKMDYTPSVVGSEISSKRDKKIASKHDPDYDTKGFSYGADPIATSKKRDRPKVEYFTPAPKDLARDLERHLVGNGNTEDSTSRKSTDKKRKRHSSHHLEEFELARRPSREASEDAIMSDAPLPASAYTPSFHTGLTGGLTRLLSRDDRYSDNDDNNRTAHYKDTPAPSRTSRPPKSQPSRTTYIVKDSRAHAEQQPTTSSRPSDSTALVKVKKRRSSDESRPRKHHRGAAAATSEYHDEGTATTTTSSTHHHRRRKRSKHRSPSPTTTTTTRRPPVRAIDYHPNHNNNDDDDGGTDQQHQQQQLILYRSRAEFFMSFITKGPESESGTSMNKALKRYHRERTTTTPATSSMGTGTSKGTGTVAAERERDRERDNKGKGKEEEEKELWKGLRLKRNSRGEVVVFF